MWYLYILETQDTRLYTGITNDVKRRLEMHKKGKGARFTRMFGVKKLRYTEQWDSRSSALKREHAVKRLSREEKLALFQKKRKSARKKRIKKTNND